MNNNSTKLIAVLAVVGLLGFGLWSMKGDDASTPKGSLKKMATAMQAKDYAEFSKYFDPKAVSDDLADKIIAEVVKQKGKDLTAEQKPMFEKLMKEKKGETSKAMEDKLKELVEGGTGAMGFGDVLAITQAKITEVDGNKVKAEVNGGASGPITLYMKNMGDYWQVYAMDMDLSTIAN